MNRKSKHSTAGGFRLIRAFSVEHNADRLRHYIDSLRRRPDARRWMARHRLHRRINARCNQGGVDV